VIVLDASAVIALLNNEPGADVVKANLAGSAISIVNVTEVLSKFVERGKAPEGVLDDIRALGIVVYSLDEQQSLIAAQLRRITVVRGLSLGDRVCLALATVQSCEVLTAERAWAGLPHGVPVKQIR
jgi:PIN domain nuclease of toxin-antitoxin system